MQPPEEAAMKPNGSENDPPLLAAYILLGVSLLAFFGVGLWLADAFPK